MEQVFAYPISDWKYAVAHDETLLSYEEWVQQQQDQFFNAQPEEQHNEN